MSGERNWVKYIRNKVDRLSAVGSWVKHLMHCGGHGAVLCRDAETYVDIPFIYCSEQAADARQLALIVKNS